VIHPERNSRPLGISVNVRPAAYSLRRNPPKKVMGYRDINQSEGMCQSIDSRRAFSKWALALCLTGPLPWPISAVSSTGQLFAVSQFPGSPLHALPFRSTHSRGLARRLSHGWKTGPSYLLSLIRETRALFLAGCGVGQPRRLKPPVAEATDWESLFKPTPAWTQRRVEDYKFFH